MRERGPCCPYEEHPVSDRISCNPDRLESPDTVSRPDYGRGGVPKLGMGTEGLHTDLTMGGPPQTGPGYGGPTYRPDYGGGAPQTGHGYGGPTYRPDYGGGGLPKLGLGTEGLHTDLTMGGGLPKLGMGTEGLHTDLTMGGGGASPNWAWVRRAYIQT